MKWGRRWTCCSRRLMLHHHQVSCWKYSHFHHNKAIKSTNYHHMDFKIIACATISDIVWINATQVSQDAPFSSYGGVQHGLIKHQEKYHLAMIYILWHNIHILMHAIVTPIRKILSWWSINDILQNSPPRAASTATSLSFVSSLTSGTVGISLVDVTLVDEVVPIVFNP